MFYKKEMRKIQLNQIGKYMMMGEPVYMVMPKGLSRCMKAKPLWKQCHASFHFRRQSLIGIVLYMKELKHMHFLCRENIL